MSSTGPETPRGRSSCQRVATFHSPAQRQYSKNAEQMLMRSKEYQHFAALKAETETLRTAWGLGTALLIIILYVDWILWMTGAADRFWGALLSLLPHRVAAVAALFLCAYLVGFLLLAPWCGWSGAIEDVSKAHVVIAHLLASAVFALRPVRPQPMPGTLRYAANELNFISDFIPALAPLLAGYVWTEFARRRWRERTLLRLPLLWLPPVCAFSALVYWAPLYIFTRPGNDFDALRALFPGPGKSEFKFVISEERVVQFLVSSFVAGEVYVLMLLATLLETYVAFPLLKWIVVPSTPRRWGLYLVGCVAFLFRTYREEETSQTLLFYWVALYGIGLFLRGIPNDDEEL